MRKIGLALIALMFISWSIGHGQTERNVQFGIITDFTQSEVLDSFLQVIIDQIDQVTGAAISVTLDDDHIVYGQQDPQAISGIYNSLSSDVDYILLVGGVSIMGSLSDEFTVPTIGLNVIDPVLQNLPYTSGISGVPNFTYLWVSRDLQANLVAFKELYPFEQLAMLVNSESMIMYDSPRGRQVLDSIADIVECEIVLVPISSDIEASLSAMPQNTDAVYMTTLNGMAESQISQISQELVDRELPSFAEQSVYVEWGMLAGIADDNFFEQAFRRLALMVDDALGGYPLADMGVEFELDRELFINMQTARDIKFSPPFDHMFRATLIEEADSALPVYSIEEILARAIETNLTIGISNKQVEIAEQDIISARSNLLPQVDIAFAGSQSNPAFPELGIAERQLSGDLALNQVVFSEEVNAGLRISKLLNEAQKYTTQGDILIVLFDTYNAYFNVLLGKTDVVIQEEYLENSRTNLSMARTRVNVGSASIADIYRWESEVANSYQSVVEAKTALIAAKLQLNNLLANTLEDEFDIGDITLQDETYLDFVNSPVSGMVNSASDIRLMADFLVSEALRVNPDKLALLENVKVAERLALRNERLLYTPNVGLQAQTSQILLRGGEGSTEPPGVDFINNSWQIGLFLKYPIFQGKARRAALQKARIELEQLEYSNLQLDQSIDLAIRSSILDVVAASTNIPFSETSATNARLNLELIRDNYREGTVNITQTIDAQQSALLAAQNYAISVYQYLRAQIQLEFSIGSYSAFRSQAENAALEARFVEFKSLRENE